MLFGMATKAQINTDQVMRIGQNALYFEDYILSIQYFNQVIKYKPYLAEPYFYRSVAKIELDDYKGAEEDASMCIERKPFITKAYHVRGVARHNQGKYAEAIEDYDVGLQTEPKSKDFLLNKAICQVQLKRYGAADTTFAKLLEVDPKNYKAYLAMAQMDISRGDSAKALEDIDKSLVNGKKTAMAYAMRAEININFKKDMAAALVDMDSLIVLEP